MRIDVGRAAVATIALAEVGALIGVSLAWLYLVGRTLLWEGALDLKALLGAGVWAMWVGLPLGALAAPLLGLTVLRRTPLKRALGLPTAGALLGLAASALFHHGAALPIPGLTLLLLVLGLLVGVLMAIGYTRLMRHTILLVPRSVGITSFGKTRRQNQPPRR